MTLLPVVQHELRRAMRNKWTHWTRMVAAGLAFGIACFMFLFWLAANTGGYALFATLSFLGALFCLVDGVHATADCISSEKRNGTLGLLFLTELNGFDIVLGKLASTTLRSFYGLMATFPVLSLSMLMGGVTAGQFWSMVVVLITILVISQSIAVFVSSIAWKERSAVSSTMTLLTIIVFGPLIPGWIAIIGKSRYGLGLDVFSPYTLYCSALNPGNNGGRFFESWLANMTVAIGFLTLAGLRVRHHWQTRPVADGAGRRAARRRIVDEPRRLRQLELNPMLWLVLRFHRPGLSWGPVFIYIAIALTSVGLGPGKFLTASVVAAWGINLLVKVHLAREGARIGADLRHNHQIDLLLTTPLGLTQILDGLAAAMRILIFPASIVLLVVEFVFIATATWFAFHELAGVAIILPVLFAAVYLPLNVLDFFAFAHTALWFGFSTGKASTGASRTGGWLVLLPIILTPFYGIVFFYAAFLAYFAPSLILLLWSRDRLKSQFLHIATTGQKNIVFGSLPNDDFALLSNPPPVISPGARV